MASFAHLADLHIGAWRDLRLRELKIKSFENAIDSIMKRGVDFVVISGDLFHVNPFQEVSEESMVAGRSGGSRE